jgi:hypothetical protein
MLLVISQGGPTHGNLSKGPIRILDQRPQKRKEWKKNYGAKEIN